MNAPAPIPTPAPAVDEKPGWQPTGSTYTTAIGGALATVILGIMASYGHTLDPASAAGLATICAAATGYFFEGGRK